MHFKSDNPRNRKRNHHIQVWLDDEEYQQLNIMTAYTNQSREGVLRDLIMGISIKEKPPIEYGEILRELRMIGNNINQITATLHSHGFLDTPQLGKVLCRLNNVEDKISKYYTE